MERRTKPARHASEMYFANLNQDLTHLGVLPPNSPQSKQIPEDYGGLTRILWGVSRMLSQERDRHERDRVSQKPARLRTNLGRDIMSCYVSGLRFGNPDRLGFRVNEAEEYDLFDSLADLGSLRRPGRQKILLTHHSNPVGLIKRLGEPILYGLDDAFELGIVAGAFSVPLRGRLRSELAHLPWKQEAIHLQPFMPVRYAALQVPSSARKGFDLGRSNINNIDHTWVASRAGTAYERARPMNRFMWHPLHMPETPER